MCLTVRAAEYDGIVSIEHEDSYMSVEEGLDKAISKPRASHDPRPPHPRPRPSRSMRGSPPKMIDTLTLKYGRISTRVVSSMFSKKT